MYPLQTVKDAAGRLRSAMVIVCSSRLLSDMPQEANAADRDPFRNVQVAVVIETGIVWMNKAASLPVCRLAAHFEVIAQYLCTPVRIVTKMSNHFVVFVKQ